MRPAIWVAFSLATGIALAGLVRPHPALALASVLLAAALAAMLRGRVGIVALLLTVAFFGGFRYAHEQTAGRGNLGAWLGQKVPMIGTVTTEPVVRGTRGTSFVVSVERVGRHPASGTVYVTQREGAAPGFGERVAFEGRLKEPTGARTPVSFNQADYLARQGVYLAADTPRVTLLGPGSLNIVQRLAVATRLRLEAVLKATLPPREAALMAGLLFGSRSELPDDLKEAFRQSGVFHLLAVSGGNVAMILLPLLALLRRLGLSRRSASALAIPVVIFFVFLTGASPSVLRAGLMAVLVLLGDVLGRERNALNTLGSAVGILLLVQPRLLFDLGFQLSAAATLGILLFARPIETWLSGQLVRWCGARIGPWLAAGLSVTLAAQVLVEPISLYSFGAVSTVAPLANLIVLAFLEPVVHIGMASTLLGLIWHPIAWILNWPVRLALWLLVSVVEVTAAIPGAYLEVGRLPLFGVMIWYMAVAAAAMPAWRGRFWQAFRTTARGGWGGSFRSRLAVAMGLVLAASTALTWRLALAEPADTLWIHVIDVGQGDAILVEAPGGISMLVDAGGYVPAAPTGGRRGYDAGTEVILPFLRSRGIRRLDYLVLTHPDQDHAGGGPSILDGMEVGAVLKSGGQATEGRYLQALALAAENGVPLYQPVAGHRMELGRGPIVEIINPQPALLVGTRSDDNSNCIAFRLVYRRVSALFACDMEAVTEEALIAGGTDLRADVLKVSHHGSGHSTTEPFLLAVRPRWAIISAGNGNPFRHPHDGTLKRLAAAGAQVYRTDRHGTVTVRTDGYTTTLVPARRRLTDTGTADTGLLGRAWLGAW